MLKPPTEYVPPPPPPPLEQSVKERALKKLQALAKGNGIKPESISVASAGGQTLSFPARTYIRLSTQYTSRTEAGKIEKGEAIGTPAAFEQALKNMTIQTQREAAKRRVITDLILARPDKGYGARDQVIKFDTMARDFVSHEGCAACSQSGKTTCHKCGGQSFITCQTCHGKQNILCQTCRGAGQVTHNGKSVTCNRCKGRNRIACPACQGRGQTQCKTCSASGSVSCVKCKATGWLSHIAHVELLGHLHFDYDRQGLPIELTKLLDAFAPKYVEKKDVEATVLMQEYNENEPPESIPIDYNVRVPHGEITFNMGKKRTISATMLGWNGEIIKAPDFLDDLTKKGQGTLARAAQGEGNVGGQLRDAARYRILREAIILSAAQSTTRKALSHLLLKYPVGMSSDKMLQLLMQAARAMQIITRKPRIAGLVLGMLIFTGFCATYFLNLRALLPAELSKIPKVDPMLSLILCDVMLIPLGTLTGVIFAQVFAGDALKKTLKGLASPATIKRIMPKIDWTIWASATLALAITGAFYFTMVLK